MGSFAPNAGVEIGSDAFGAWAFGWSEVWHWIGPSDWKRAEAMNHARPTLKSAATPAGKTQSAPKAASNAPRGGEPTNSFEQEATYRDQVSAGAVGNPDWSLSTIAASTFLQSKDQDCRNVTGGEFADCKRRSYLQAKLAISACNDPFELEADRIADQVLAASPHSPISGAMPQIQRMTS